MSLRRVVAIVAVLIGSGFWGVAAAHAQDRKPLDLSLALANSPGALAAAPIEDLALTMGLRVRREQSSSLLNALYASTAAMQALDVHSTLQALGRGAVESNGVMAGVTERKAVFVALKAGVAFSTVMAARNMSKRNKVAAVATLVAINSAYAMVVRHNYRVARHLR